MKNFKRVLSMLIVVMMVAAMFVPAFANEAVEATEAAEAYITSDGATIKVHNLFDIKDVSLAEGEYSTYREVKNNLMVSVTSKSNKVVDNTFTYIVTHGGMHTVAIRYNDGTNVVLTHEIVVTDPVFTTNGLQIIVSNLGDDVKTIRTSTGTLNSVQEIKKTAGSRSFSQNHIKYAESFLLQYREEGPVTVVVDYVHGYKVFYHYDVTKTVPTVAYGDDFVKFGNLDNLHMIRYAAGVYSSSAEIKASGISKVLKSDAIDENGYITVADLPVNTYTFCVQYKDDSYNIYVVDITVKQYTITFDTDGGTMDAGFKTVYGVNYGDYYADVFGGTYPTASMEGYDFKGWFLEKYNFTLTEGDVTGGGYYAVSEDCTLVALWEEKAPELGSYENPYLINVGDSRFVVYLPAGEGAYVKANDSNGSVLTVGYATTNTYDISYLPGQYIEIAEDGTATFTMIAEKDFFYIANSGEEAVTIYMALEAGAAADTTGTWDNPEALELTEQFGALRAFSTKDLAAGNQGYYYTITAPADGKLGFNVSANDAEWNDMGWQFFYIKNDAVYSDTYTSIDYAYETIFADVVAGDEITLVVATLDANDPWNNPAATINVNVAFVEYGSSDAPFAIEAGTQLATVNEGSQGVYYTYTAPAAGTVDVIMYSESWTYVVNNLTSYVYGDTQWSDSDPVVPMTTVEVAEGDEIMVMVNTYDPANPWNAPAGTISWELCFNEATGDEPTEPELGSFDNPYLLNAGEMRLAVTVPAGGEAYVSVNDTNNSLVTIGYSTANTWTVYYGRMNVYTPAEDGTASFNMVPGGDYFCVVNSGDEDVVLYMILEAGEASEVEFGTMDNPEVLTITQNMWGGAGAYDETELAAGNQGYWYTTTAPADGIITVSPGAWDAEYNNIGWLYNVNNVTDGIYGDNHWSDDAEPVYYEAWNVSAGDVLNIFISTYDPANMWNNPAGTVTVNLNFDAVGSSNCPIEIEAGYQSTELAAGTDGMYFTYTAPEDGTVDVIMYSENWMYCVNNITSGTYGDTHWSNDEEPVFCETVAVTAGDELQIMVNTFDPENEWNPPAGTISWDLVFTAGEAEEPEEAELGSYENPYILNSGDTRLAAFIPAGETVYVKAIDCNNAIFTLGYATIPTYEIWYLRQQYVADENGMTTFTMVADVDTFGITNTGDEDITVYMALEGGEAVDTTGTWSNPAVITDDGIYTATLGANTDGYFYTYTAPVDGTVTIAMTQVDGWFYNVNNVTGGIYGDFHYCDDETPVMYETIAVSAGDEVQITMNTYDGSWSAPEGEIVWSFNFTQAGKAYTITLDVDGGVLNAPTTYACNTGDTYYDIFGGYYPVPTMEGYEFGGWFLEMYGFTLTEGDVVNGGYYAVAHDCTLVAIWNAL